MINEKPILMSNPMVQAIVNGRKTQTRRLRGLNEINENPDDWTILLAGTPNSYELARGGDDEDCAMFRSGEKIRFIKIPYPERGDLLWVRETFCPAYFDDGSNGYKAEWNDFAAELITEPKWKPSIFMPKVDCRIFLLVESISLERVQSISEEDAVAEGVEVYEIGEAYKDYMNPKSGSFISSYGSFSTLWQSINGSESWRANPWVWVVKYRILSTSGRPSDEVIAANQKGLLAPNLI
jgi:hypothetical protein